MSWKRTRTSSAGKFRHSGYYRNPCGATRSAGTFTRFKDALSAADEQETLTARGTWVECARGLISTRDGFWTMGASAR